MLILICFELKRILSPCLASDVETFKKVEAFTDAYPATYQTLYQAKPITCSVTGATFDAVLAPCAVILDVSVQSTMASSS